MFSLFIFFHLKLSHRLCFELCIARFSKNLLNECKKIVGVDMHREMTSVSLSEKYIYISMHIMQVK